MRAIPKLVRAMLDRHGISYTAIRGRKHHKLKAELPAGNITFVLAGSPSDYRALANQYHQTRHKLIEGGVAFQECKDLIRD